MGDDGRHDLDDAEALGLGRFPDHVGGVFTDATDDLVRAEAATPTPLALLRCTQRALYPS